MTKVSPLVKPQIATNTSPKTDKTTENIFDKAKEFCHSQMPMRHQLMSRNDTAKTAVEHMQPLDLSKASKALKVPQSFRKPAQAVEQDLSKSGDEPLDLSIRKRGGDDDWVDSPPPKRVLSSGNLNGSDLMLHSQCGLDTGVNGDTLKASQIPHRTSIFPKPAHTNTDSLRQTGGPRVGPPYGNHLLRPSCALWNVVPPMPIAETDHVRTVQCRGKPFKVSPVRPQVNGMPVFSSQQNSDFQSEPPMKDQNVTMLNNNNSMNKIDSANDEGSTVKYVNPAVDSGIMSSMCNMSQHRGSPLLSHLSSNGCQSSPGYPVHMMAPCVSAHPVRMTQPQGIPPPGSLHLRTTPSPHSREHTPVAHSPHSGVNIPFSPPPVVPSTVCSPHSSCQSSQMSPGPYPTLVNHLNSPTKNQYPSLVSNPSEGQPTSSVLPLVASPPPFQTVAPTRPNNSRPLPIVVDIVPVGQPLVPQNMANAPQSIHQTGMVSQQIQSPNIIVPPPAVSLPSQQPVGGCQNVHQLASIEQQTRISAESVKPGAEPMLNVPKYTPSPKPKPKGKKKTQPLFIDIPNRQNQGEMPVKPKRPRALPGVLKLPRQTLVARKSTAAPRRKKVNPPHPLQYVEPTTPKLCMISPTQPGKVQGLSLPSPPMPMLSPQTPIGPPFRYIVPKGIESVQSNENTPAMISTMVKHAETKLQKELSPPMLFKKSPENIPGDKMGISRVLSSQANPYTQGLSLLSPQRYGFSGGHEESSEETVKKMTNLSRMKNAASLFSSAKKTQSFASRPKRPMIPSEYKSLDNLSVFMITQKYDLSPLSIKGRNIASRSVKRKVFIRDQVTGKKRRIRNITQTKYYQTTILKQTQEDHVGKLSKRRSTGETAKPTSLQEEFQMFKRLKCKMPEKLLYTMMAIDKYNDQYRPAGSELVKIDLPGKEHMEENMSKHTESDKNSETEQTKSGSDNAVEDVKIKTVGDKKNTNVKAKPVCDKTSENVKARTVCDEKSESVKVNTVCDEKSESVKVKAVCHKTSENVKIKIAVDKKNENVKIKIAGDKKNESVKVKIAGDKKNENVKVKTVSDKKSKNMKVKTGDKKNKDVKVVGDLPDKEHMSKHTESDKNSETEQAKTGSDKPVENVKMKTVGDKKNEDIKIKIVCDKKSKRMKVKRVGDKKIKKLKIKAVGDKKSENVKVKIPNCTWYEIIENVGNGNMSGTVKQPTVFDFSSDSEGDVVQAHSKLSDTMQRRGKKNFLHRNSEEQRKSETDSDNQTKTYSSQSPNKSVQNSSPHTSPSKSPVKKSSSMTSDSTLKDTSSKESVEVGKIDPTCSVSARVKLAPKKLWSKRHSASQELTSDSDWTDIETKVHNKDTPRKENKTQIKSKIKKSNGTSMKSKVGNNAKNTRDVPKVKRRRRKTSMLDELTTSNGFVADKIMKHFRKSTDSSFSSLAHDKSKSPENETEEERNRIKKTSLLNQLKSSHGYIGENKFDKKNTDLWADPSKLSREERALQVSECSHSSGICIFSRINRSVMLFILILTKASNIYGFSASAPIASIEFEIIIIIIDFIYRE